MKRSVIACAAFALAAVSTPVVTQSQGVRTDTRGPDTAAIASAALDARAAAISATLRCPVCQGESIQDSPSELAGQMRAIVREQLAAGRTPDDVKAYFVGRYGEWILLEPAVTGLNVLLYAFPVLLVVGGLFFVSRLVKRWSKTEPNAQP